MTPPSCRVQRGAVTLVGAMFLIVTIIVMLGVAQRMAATDITDTALQSDAVEALFLAETGLERAAYRYANGTACAAIAGETDNAGRGSFLILTSVFIDPICRVRVEGSVVTTIVANTVTRTVEGDLKKGGFLGWAVGQRAGGQELLLAWDGSTWTRPAPYPGIPNRDLYGVFCMLKDDCWAVGQRSNGRELIIHWDGSAWSRLGPTNVFNRNLYDVTCVASDDCWTVGQQIFGFGNIGHWNGATWSFVIPPWPTGDLNGVHCVDSNDCWAVGDDVFFEMILHWNGAAWSRMPNYGSIPNNRNLESVYCVATDDCWAVGQRQQGGGSPEIIIHWDGAVWTRMGPYGSVPNRDLDDVTCVTTDFCWAVGRRQGRENINFWNGVTWSRWPSTTIANRNLRAVQMVDATEGYIVGDNGTTGVWDGTTWTGQAPVVNRRLYEVSVVAGP